MKSADVSLQYFIKEFTYTQDKVNRELLTFYFTLMKSFKRMFSRDVDVMERKESLTHPLFYT